MTSEASYILFPNDAPVPLRTPEYFKVQQSEAEARLMRSEKPDADAAATRLFPNESAGAADTAKPAVAEGQNVADRLFPKDSQDFDSTSAADFFDGFANSAVADGDVDRAQALNAAGEALIDDARTAGTQAADLTAALDIVRERQGDTVAAPSEEKRGEEFASSMAAIQAECGEDYLHDLGAAQAFIRDLEIIAPGTIASLNHTGSGNDIRLIRAAIKEARRRGYGSSK